MKDIIVSVRMPVSMLEQLKKLAKKNHFLDVSEEIRTIVREKTMKYSSPYNVQVKKIVDDIRQEVQVAEKIDSKKELIKSLKHMLEQLENE